MEHPYKKRIALVTGANKGIGLEICRQLLEKGVTVVLTARSESRGQAAVSQLNPEGTKDVIFHQLDVADAVSIASLKEFIQSQFGRLDILVNNAAVSGLELESEFLKGYNSKEHDLSTILPWSIQKYEKAKECIDINYYGTKRIEAIKSELRDADNLTEKRLDEIVCSFLNDSKANNLKEDTWPPVASAYKVSKVAVAAYTRILAREHTELCINCVHPGYVTTDITWNTGECTVEEGARGPVMVALLPDGCSSGQYYFQTELSSFE